jgi:tetratricopeptide (TPR) repeat protein
LGTLGTPPLQDHRVWVAALNAGAALAAAQHDYGHARPLAQTAVAAARVAGDASNEIDGLLVLGREALSHRNAVAEADTFFTRAAALAGSHGDDWHTARALYWLGYRNIFGDASRCVQLLEECPAHYRACGDPAGIAAVLSVLGDQLVELGEVARGLGYLREAVSLLDRTHPSAECASAMLMLADALGAMCRYPEAEALLDRALAICATIGAKSVAARCHALLGRLALQQGMDARAEVLIAESLRLARAADSTFELVYALWSQGAVLIERGQYAQAEGVYQQCLHHVEGMTAVAIYLLELGVVALRQGQMTLAHDRLEHGLSLTVRPFYSAPGMAALGRVALEEGDLDKAEHLL